MIDGIEFLLRDLDGRNPDPLALATKSKVMLLVVEPVECSIVIWCLRDKGLYFGMDETLVVFLYLTDVLETHKHGGSPDATLDDPGILGIGNIHFDSRWEIDIPLELIAILVDPVHGVSEISLSRCKFFASFAFHVVKLRDTTKK